jgi:DNA repair exonuclease SbcCD ATPase subunit
VLDHPLTGARQLRLRLWADGAELVESRPATTDETRGLKAGGLPTLSAAADGTLKAELERAADTLAALGERVPRDVPAAANRLAEIDGQLAKPAIAYEEEAYVRARSDATAADALLNQATADLGKLPPVVVLKQQIEAAHADVTSLEDELRQLAARWQLAAPDLGAIPAAAVLASEEEQRRSTHLAGELGQRDGVQGQLDELDRSERERESELAECQQNLAVDTDERLMEEQRLLTEQRAALQADAEGLAIAVARTFAGASSEDAGVLLGEAQRLCDEASVEVASLEQKASELDGATQRLASAQDGRAALREKMVAELDGLAVELGTVGTVSLPSSAAEIHALATDRLASLGQELERLDEAGARAAEQEAQRTLGAAEGAVGRALDDARSLAERAIEAATQLGHSVPLPEKAEAAEPAAVADSLLQACPDAAAELPTHAEIEEQLGTLEQQVGRLEQARQQARATLGDEPPMPLDAAQTALRTLELDLKARERAREIVGVTRQRMINKVVPDTIHNMCLLLPLLTAGRYRYAELTPDYRLQVWDERKHGYVEKNLYSGGTQDQFSLALRLGFALAALPRELGTSPGFLFLDEPLSSFDQDRTAALVDLLTLGHVGTFFQQVFLISHSQAFDRALFTHHVLMEEGQVVESTFPGPAAQATGGE